MALSGTAAGSGPGTNTHTRETCSRFGCERETKLDSASRSRLDASGMLFGCGRQPVWMRPARGQTRGPSCGAVRYGGRRRVRYTHGLYSRVDASEQRPGPGGLRLGCGTGTGARSDTHTHTYVPGQLKSISPVFVGGLHALVCSDSLGFNFPAFEI